MDNANPAGLQIKAPRRRSIPGWQVWLGLVISVFFLYWAVRQASDLSLVMATIYGANYWLLVPALIAYFLGVGVRALRWRFLLHPVKHISGRRLFPVVVIGYMANDVLPARMGEFVRAYVLDREEGIGKSVALATIFVERLFDGLTMLLFAAVVALLVPLGEGLDNLVRLAALVLAALLVIGLAVAASPSRTMLLLSWLLHLVPSRFRPRITDLADRFLSGLAILQRPRAMASVLALSVAAWLCEAAMYYLLGFGFGLDLGFPAFVLTTAVVNLGTMVPSSPGYVGTFEFLALLTLGRFAVDADLALGYTAVLHAALLIPVTLLGFYYMWRRQLSLRMKEK